jgi:carbon storage regulator
MLVLSRKEGEQIVVPEYELTVTVLEIHGERVRLGISAPAEVRVYRGEILPLVHACNVRQETVTTLAQKDTSMLPRVLIADPDDYLLDSYRDYLEQHGFGVVTATTGLECVERLRECAPDVLVLEPSIPWGWGDGVLAMMHEEPDIPLVPVIVLTYGRDRGVLYRSAPFKIDDYQLKPLRPERLAQRIRNVATQRQFAASPVKQGGL